MASPRAGIASGRGEGVRIVVLMVVGEMIEAIAFAAAGLIGASMLAHSLVYVTDRKDRSTFGLAICLVGGAAGWLFPYLLDSSTESMVPGFVVWQAAVGALWWLGAASEEWITS